MNFNQILTDLLKQCDKFCDNEGNLLKQNIKHRAQQFNADLIELLLNNQDTKAHFFDKVSDATVFNYRKFIDYIDDKNFLIDSYTKFSNKIGLTISNKHIQQVNDVVLSFPFKDCVLEGGQTKDDEKRKEIFFNEVLAKDEINRLLDKKVITNAKKYTKDGTSDEVNFNRDENGVIKDNLIIKGNNLLALHTLKSNFAGKVKLIYIDPPYNTGNDSFNYNDNFNHSTWLTFMKNRLEVARDLLSDDGVIFVQCDDNEQAYLKVLMDEVFERKNFVNDIIWNSTKSVTNTAIISVSHTHTLLFFKEKNYFIKNRTEFRLNEDGRGFNNLDNDSRGLWKADPFQVGGWRPNQQYEIKNTNTGEIYKPNIDCSWKNDQEKFKQLLADNRIVFGMDGKSAPQRKRFLFEAKARGKVSKTIWNDVDTTTNGTQHLKKIFEKNIFDNPKPEKLLQRIIELSTQKGDIVLDYHLGSGTTGAVAHKMGRQYIGIEQMDYIEDIAVKRMQKVIGKKVKKDGELLESLDFDTGGISESVNWQGGGEFVYFELDKYNQKYIDNLNAIKRGHSTTKTTKQLYDEIAEHAFLNYDIDSKKLLENKSNFEKLSLANQLEFLFSILNKNQLYKNLSEMDDKDLGVSDKIKQLNKYFYEN